MCLILYATIILIAFLNFLELKRAINGNLPPLWVIPYLLILSLCIPIAIILLGMFALYRELVRIILKFKYGTTFVGFLSGPDAFHTAGEPIQQIINFFSIYKCPKSMSPQVFYENIKKSMYNLCMVPKCNVAIKRQFGYSYMLNKKANIEGAIKQMKIIKTENHKASKKELMSLINEYANSDLPKNNTVAWEILVGAQPIEWRSDDYNYYPILIRFHHAMADGTDIIKLLTAALGNIESTSHSSSSSYTGCKGLEFLKLFGKKFLELLLLPSWHVSTLELKGKDKNVLINPRLLNQCHYVVNVTKNRGYVSKIKKIKKRVPGVSFSDILLTAISASLNDFFKTNPVFVNHIYTIVPVCPDSSDLTHLQHIGFKDLKLANNYSMLRLELPVFVGYTVDQSDVVNRLNLISKQTKNLKTSFQYSSYRIFLTTACAYLPQPLVASLTKLTSCTAILSFLPGTPIVTCFDGLATMADIAAWGPHVGDSGLTVVIITYDDRLQIAVSADKALIKNCSDVQDIADNIPKHLCLLEEEILK